MNTNINTIRGTKYIQSVDGDFVPVDSPRGIEAKELEKLKTEDKLKEREAEQKKAQEEVLLKKKAEMAKLEAEIARMDTLKTKATAPSKRKVTSKDAE